MPRNHKLRWNGITQLLLVPIVATLAWSGCEHKISRYQKQKSKKALASLEKTQVKLKTTEKKLMALVAQDQDFMSKSKTVKKAKAQLEKLRAEIKDLKTKGKKISKLLKGNKGKNAFKVRQLTQKMNASLKKMNRKLMMLVGPVATLRNAKKNAKKLIQEVSDTRTRITTYPPKSIVKAVKKAIKKYPKAQERIDARVKVLGGKDVLAMADAFDAARKKTPPDYLAMGQLARKIRSATSTLNRNRKRLITHLDELDDHVDVILVDMKDERGRFFHKYKSVRGNKVKTTAWSSVNATFYRKHKDHLGMALYAKPKGTFHTGAITIASPPGYAYVGHDEYGSWKDKGGEKTWKFKPKYAYMVPLFFGAGLAAVTYVAYRSYNKRRKRNLVWFGLAGAIWYGTRSARMRRRHKGFYARRARKVRMRKAKARRLRSRRSGRSGRSSRRSGK